MLGCPKPTHCVDGVGGQPTECIGRSGKCHLLFGSAFSVAFIADRSCRVTAGITAASKEVEQVKTWSAILGTDNVVAPRTALASVLIGASVAETGTKKGWLARGKPLVLRAADRELNQ